MAANIRAAEGNALGQALCAWRVQCGRKESLANLTPWEAGQYGDLRPLASTMTI